MVAEWWSVFFWRKLYAKVSINSPPMATPCLFFHARAILHSLRKLRLVMLS
ncbi:Uncharacterised protein [Mycobacteroides abscessus subsp. abscessus]|nr:Uncharacterised protein [Mycobacteroides abscessus subsp. abscessus]